MITWLTAPLSYAFMQRGLLAAVIVGVLCAVIGCYVVLRSMAFIGDAMAHAILPGVALAYLLKGNLTVGALVAAVAVALGIGLLSRQGTIKEDTAIGILFAAALSLGIVLISSIRTYAVDLTHILFGNVLGVSNADAGRGGPGGHCPAVQTVPGYLLRSCTGGYAAPAAQPAAQPASNPSGTHHRRLDADRRCGPGGCHAGYAWGNRLSANPSSAHYDDRLCGDWRSGERRRALPELLPQRRLGCRCRARGHRHVPGGFPAGTTTGSAAAASAQAETEWFGRLR